MKRNAKTIYSASFVSAYGKLWEVRYTMEDRDTIGDIVGVRIDGNEYKITCWRRERRLIELINRHYANLVEHACELIYEAFETHHMQDDNI